MWLGDQAAATGSGAEGPILPLLHSAVWLGGKSPGLLLFHFFPGPAEPSDRETHPLPMWAP